MGASASSYASSTVWGTIERSSCSRSHGHSTRRRRVISSRRARLARAPSSTGQPPLVLVPVLVVGGACCGACWVGACCCVGAAPEAGVGVFVFGPFAQSGITYGFAHFVSPL